MRPVDDTARRRATFEVTACTDSVQCHCGGGANVTAVNRVNTCVYYNNAVQYLYDCPASPLHCPQLFTVIDQSYNVFV